MTTQELQLPKLTPSQRVLRLIWGGALSFGAGGFVYGLYFLLFDAVYSFPWLGLNGEYTLAKVWNDWPQTVNLPQTLSFIHIGGQGGLGTWFVGQWPAIQKIFLQGWPIGIIAGAFVALALNYGVGKKITWFDELTLKAHNVFGFIPSRLQEEPTTPAQYVFLVPMMLLFALPGAIFFFAIDLGSIALAHHYGYNGFIVHLLGATAVQITGAGFFSHQFFANKVTMKPAADFQEFFEDRALGKALAAITAFTDYATDRCDILTGIERATAAGRKVKVPWWYPPNYVRILDAKLALLAKGDLEFKERSGNAKLVMMVTLIVGVLIAIVGLYTKFWMANHGGLFL